MNRELVGEPGVSAFLQSVLQYLIDISRMQRTCTTPLFCDPRPDLEKLKKKLASLQDVLVDGEARRLDEVSVDDWMDDLKHLVYDVEDILDDIKLSLSVQPDGIDQVHFDYTRSNAINNRLGQILGRTDELVDRSKDLDLTRGVGYATWGQSQATRRTLETSPVVEMTEIHGREKDKKVFVENLMVVNDKAKKNYDVLSIVGMGGLGKTTLAQLVFNDPEVADHFDVKCWVCISNVFDVARTTKELIGYSDGGGSAGGEQSLAGLQMHLKDIVRNRRFLFVLDDVWSSSEWEKMKAPFNSCANGSKILVTTRDINIAHSLGCKEPYQLQGLDYEQCMAIFKDKAFADDEEEQEKLILGKKIVRACGGVPLAVKVIGSMLEMAEEEKWRAVSENADLWNMNHMKNEIHPAIRLSYHYLPAALKRCFEYLAIFPPDFELNQDDVLYFWIADGLVQEVDGRMAYDIGKEYYNQLKARSLIQENNMMHDIVHHLASEVSKNFCYKKDSKQPPTIVRHAFIFYLNAMHYDFLAQARCLRTLIVNEVLGDTVDRNTISFCKMLRTLKICSRFHYWGLSGVETSISQMTHLRYLSIEGSDVKNLPDSICMLVNLQVLDLSGNHKLIKLSDKINHLSNLLCLILSSSSISSLPESICELSKLQVLNIRNCNRLEQLPKHIGNLRSLRTLDLAGTQLNVPDSILNVTGLRNLLLDTHEQLPLYIGRLARLEELPEYHAGKEKGRSLGELKMMNMLKGELIIASMENIRDVEEALMADIKSKKKIWGFHIMWSEPGNVEEMEVKILEALEPHPALQSLTFYNYSGDKFPTWIMPNNNSCANTLTSLHMKGLINICQMVGMEFVSLQTLWIDYCPRLRKFLMATPKLNELHLMNCPDLEVVDLFPSLSEKVGMHSIVSQLEGLGCANHVFEYFFEMLKATNSKWQNLTIINISAEGRRVASLPEGWPSMMACLHIMDIEDIAPGNFQFVPDGDQSPFPPSLNDLNINLCEIKERLPHHSYTIMSDGKVEMEYSIDRELEGEESDPESRGA